MIDESALAYWDGRYQVGAKHHATQNAQISGDLLLAVHDKPRIHSALQRANRIIEIGCGAGDLTHLIGCLYRRKGKLVIGTDLSAVAVLLARRRYPHDFWEQLDILNDSLANYVFDLAVCSNTLEHFRDPHAAIERMFELAPTQLLVVPLNQPCTDGYEHEGGAGHVFTFTRATFKRYHLVESCLFTTKGWQHSSKGEKPRQLAVLIARR